MADYPKPYLALMDGIVLGGGIGVSAHAEYRVVTERSRVGMPEVGIGLIPDVGGTWLLSRAPGELGTYVALTGEQLGAGDAVALGLADVFVPTERLDDLLDRATEVGVHAAVAQLVEPAPASQLAARRSQIDDQFGHDDVRDILAAVDDDLRAVITAKSPTSLVLTLRALRTARTLNSLEEALEMEFRLVTRLLRSHDLREGIRAQVIDKDRNPQWSPSSVDGVDPGEIDRFFAPLHPNGQCQAPDRQHRGRDRQVDERIVGLTGRHGVGSLVGHRDDGADRQHRQVQEQ